MERAMELDPGNAKALSGLVSLRGDSLVDEKTTPSPGRSGSKPVFIIGMPRSGTSLCEQVLSTHSKVFACGELATMEHIEKSFVRRQIDPYQLDLSAKKRVFWIGI